MLSKLLSIRICRCRFVLTFRWSELFPKEWRPARKAASQQHNNVLVEFSTKNSKCGKRYSPCKAEFNTASTSANASLAWD